MSDKIEHNPAVYLSEPPTDEEQRQAAKIPGAHLGDRVPHYQLRRVADRLYAISELAERIEGLWSWIRRGALAVCTLAVANLGAVAYHTLAKHDDAVAAEQRAKDEERAFELYKREQADQRDQLRQDIRELREKLLKLSGVDPRAVGVVAIGAP